MKNFRAGSFCRSDRIILSMILLMMIAIAGFGSATAVFADEDLSVSDRLQAMIDEAGDSVTITLDGDVALDKTIVIPEGKTVTITNDGPGLTIDGSGVNSAFDVYGKLIIAATSDDDLVIKGGKGEREHGNIATLWGGEMILESGHLLGGDVDSLYWYGGCIAINQGGSMTMNGGKLTDFKAAYEGYMASGVVMIRNKGDFTMNGGLISDNTACSTIFALGDTSNPENNDSAIAINGGEFRSNKSYSTGSVIQANGPNITVDIKDGHFHDNESPGKGTVAALHGTNITVSGGLFENNKAKYGGAIAISGNVGDTCDALISGGTFRGNSANSGGAIYINIDGVTLTGGDISNNTADRWGGGIYINSKRSMLIKNAVLTNNTALRLGGGLWCCPTGGATIRASEGVAIFDNSISEEPGAGSDIATVHPVDGNEYQLHLSDRVLGGARVEYYKDGEVEGESLSAAVADAARYNDNAKEATVIKASSVDSYALKAVISDEGKLAANNLADLRIYDNTALCGGGIGANGGVFSGYQPPDEENPDTWSLKVIKKWDDSVEITEIKPVTVALCINGIELESVTLSEENDWQAEFTDLPDPETLESVEVVEKDGDGYAVTYSDPVKDEENRTITITVTNSKPTEVLEESEEPEKPEVKDVEEEPDKTAKAKVKGAENDPKSTSAKTGDSNSIVSCAMLMILAMTAAAGVFVRRRRSSH